MPEQQDVKKRGYDCEGGDTSTVNSYTSPYNSQQYKQLLFLLLPLRAVLHVWHSSTHMDLSTLHLTCLFFIMDILFFSNILLYIFLKIPIMSNDQRSARPGSATTG